MKKFLSLLLALLMLLSVTLAEEGDNVEITLPQVTLVTPVPFADYQQHLSDLVNAQIPDTVITWEESEESSGLWMAVSQGALMGIVCTVTDGLVNEAIFIIQGPLDDEILQVFMGMSAYTLGALVTFSGVPVDEALLMGVSGVSTEMQNVINGAPTYAFGGVPMYILITDEGEEVYTLQLVVDLIQDAAPEEVPAE